MPNLSSLRRSPQLLAIGEAIRLRREVLGLSQEEVALRSEVDRSYLGRIERGDNNAAVLTLVKIAGALNLALSELLQSANL
ncbi:helix-turn-helix domain-containing protein [Massilia sp. Root335]|uniref:helix-turn-helix domain-containing protein n=1 Tax=Massilia sp. Root335 TaxID=1736517 RepID=UPI0006F54C96|nr:helix-turn-helix transcriptional regulator [Massilia sp. Root335]KQV28622.1 DNA-binding protein [Massilia sp. Root335]